MNRTVDVPGDARVRIGIGLERGDAFIDDPAPVIGDVAVHRDQDVRRSHQRQRVPDTVDEFGGRSGQVGGALDDGDAERRRQSGQRLRVGGEKASLDPAGVQCGPHRIETQRTSQHRVQVLVLDRLASGAPGEQDCIHDRISARAGSTLSRESVARRSATKRRWRAWSWIAWKVRARTGSTRAVSASPV